MPLSSFHQQFESYTIPVAEIYGSVNEMMWYVAGMSCGARVLARKPGFAHQIEPQERGMTVNNPSVHEYAAPMPAPTP